MHDLTSASVFGPDNTRHVVLAATRVVDLKVEAIIVDRDVTHLLSGSALVAGQKTSTTIPADKVTLAVGAEYGFPSRISPAAVSKEDVVRDFKRMQQDIAAAREILVIGGGSTGVEFVGEVLDVHPKKAITLLTRGPGLITNGHDAFGSVSKSLLSQLEAKGVRVLLNDSLSLDGIPEGPVGRMETFTTKKGETISADYVMLCSGNKPNTKWIASIDANLVDPQTKLIKVNTTFGVDAPGWGAYYALGDAAATPGPKTSYVAQKHGPAVAHNIAVTIKGETDQSKLKKAVAPPGKMIVVPLGKSGGASYLMFFSAGGWLTSLLKGKGLLTDMFQGWFKA
ncbi:hypothetical protein EX895_002262 [Sporisorium graminicola]|uniref:FAD/NAD(P)-binding domain-containing protein n=1 Tax=Sporisorium graminicola TaxID=280036 RepID=A0A4U7KWE4_9BASI|nr:hypothetical protein EX895_002262 [Sporisorium graminicola]TKY89021.1 hypothetical protein EX895_002262 [Sporisorium graminicola]